MAASLVGVLDLVVEAGPAKDHPSALVEEENFQQVGVVDGIEASEAVGLHHLQGPVEQGGQVQHHWLEEELEDHLQIEYAVCFSEHLGCLQLELSL